MKKLLNFSAKNSNVKGLLKLYDDNLVVIFESLPKNCVLIIFEDDIYFKFDKLIAGENKFPSDKNLTAKIRAVLLSSERVVLGSFGKLPDYYEMQKILKKVFDIVEEKVEILKEKIIEKIETVQEEKVEKIVEEKIVEIEEENPKIMSFTELYEDKFMFEDSTLGDDLPIAEKNYFEKESEFKMQNKAKYFEKLKNLFEKFERYEPLQNYIPNSKFVKIDFDSEKFYVVGGVFENGELEYIIYGLPSSNGKYAQKLQEIAQLFPINSNLNFYLIYQDAKTGEMMKQNQQS